MNKQIVAQSQKVILDNQATGGGYIACPVMPDYTFSWFRDGAFIAYAMTTDGYRNSVTHNGIGSAQWDSAKKFHTWSVRMIVERAAALERTIERAKRGEKLQLEDTLNARYTDAGSAGPSDWPEFQLDGPALWIWALEHFVDVTRCYPLPVEWEYAIDLTGRYLAAIWQYACYDCWEERGAEVHISTLAAIYTGLKAAEKLMPSLDFSHSREAIREFIFTRGLTPTGELAKSVDKDMVDANLLLAALPNGLLAPDDPLMQRTMARIEKELLAERGGVHRHLDDVYYGGGAWVLLDLWRAWYYLGLKQTEKAKAILAWSETTADAAGNLPEQVNTTMLAPEHYAPWVEQRGEIANPLLWTHAMYLLVHHGLNENNPVS